MRYNFKKIYKGGLVEEKQLNNRNQLFFEIAKLQYHAISYYPKEIIITNRAGKDITEKIFNAYLET